MRTAADMSYTAQQQHAAKDQIGKDVVVCDCDIGRQGWGYFIDVILNNLLLTDRIPISAASNV